MNEKIDELVVNDNVKNIILNLKCANNYFIYRNVRIEKIIITSKKDFIKLKDDEMLVLYYNLLN